MPEHSPDASRPVVNQIVVELHHRPDVLNPIPPQEKTELFFCKHPLHVPPRGRAGLPVRAEHSPKLALLEEIAGVGHESSFKSLGDVSESLAVMLPAGPETKPHKGPVGGAYAMQLEAEEPALGRFPAARDPLADLVGRDVAVLADRDRRRIDIELVLGAVEPVQIKLVPDERQYESEGPVRGLQEVLVVREARKIRDVMGHGVLVEGLQVSGAVQNPDKVQRDDVRYGHPAFRPAFPVIHGEVLFPGGSLQEPVDKIVHYAV